MADYYNHEDHDDTIDQIIEFQDEEKRNRIKRGQEFNITVKDPTINDVLIGVGWDLKAFESHPLDLDVSLFLLNKNNRTREDSDFVFYNNLTGCDGAIKHKGDSRTGAGEGDDETILIALNSLPFDVAKIQFVLSIYNMDYMDHDFSMVKNVYFRLVNKSTDYELFRYELDEELDKHEGLIIGELERVGPEWIFKAIGETVKGGLGKIAKDRDIMVMQIIQE